MSHDTTQPMLRITLLALLPKDGTPMKVADLARMSGSSSRQVTDALFGDYLDGQIGFDIRTDSFSAHKQGGAL